MIDAEEEPEQGDALKSEYWQILDRYDELLRREEAKVHAYYRPVRVRPWVVTSLGRPGEALSEDLRRLARARLREPDILVLDEPVAGVDASRQADLYSLIKEIRDRRGCGVLLVSHDLNLVMAATDRVVCLNRHVCCTGEPYDVVRDPAFQTLFGVALAESMAVYRHSHDHEHGDSGQVVSLDEAPEG